MADNQLYKQATAFTKFFWSSCGAEIEVLEKCGNNDRVKYFCLGGIVLATGIMAGFAGGYAFYTIFQPKSFALSDDTHFLTAFFACIFGMLWGAMIFNLDRYIVASSGIGDGTEKITWTEFKRSLPRLVMGIVIAITISKPVEIRIFKTEIDNALYKEQLVEKAEFTKEVNSRSASRKKQLDAELQNYNRQLERFNAQITKKSDEAEKERLQRGGRGFETNRLEGEAAALRAEKTDYIATNASRIQSIRNQLEEVNKDAQFEVSKGDRVASQLDGLLQRIKLAHKIAGWPIIIFITLLFIVIELTPIFFKMMVNKSNYDIMLDEYKKNMLILSGLVPDHLNPGGRNVLREESIRQLQQKVTLQKEFFDSLYEKYKADLMSQAKLNYKTFITEKDIKIDMMPGFDEHGRDRAAKRATANSVDSKEPIDEGGSNLTFDKNESAAEPGGKLKMEAPYDETPIINEVEPKLPAPKETTGSSDPEENTTSEHPGSAGNTLDYTGPDFEEK